MVNKIFIISPTIQPRGVDILASAAEMDMAKNGEEEVLISHLFKERMAAILTRTEIIMNCAIEKAN